MRARVAKNLSDLSKKQIKDAVAAEYINQEMAHAKEVSTQLMAVVLYTLHINGATLKACKKLYNDVSATFGIIEHGILGVEMTALDCVDWVNKKLKIDLQDDIQTDLQYK